MNNIKKYESDLRLFYQASNIPICVFDNMQKDLLRCPKIASMDCSPQTMKLCSRVLRDRPETPHLPLIVFSGSCYFSLLKLDSYTNVMFGPISSVSLTYREFLEANKNYSYADDLLHLYRITQLGAHIKPTQFANNLSLYIRFAFQEDLHADKILKNCVNLFNRNIFYKADNSKSSNYITGTKAIELINKLLFYIKNGNMNDLEKITANMPIFSIHSPFPTSLKEIRSEYYGYAILCLKAVIDEGVSVQKACEIFDAYVSQIASLTRPETFSAMSSKLSADYCQQIIEIRNYTSSRGVNRCLQYIKNHIQDKITLEDLAAYCNLSKRTITRNFSEYFHMPAAEYILQLKLKEAAFLLTNSTLSLVEISNQLSFSSQSHFSVAFKKRYNYTPQQYRIKFKKD